jgi:hypothetical protein
MILIRIEKLQRLSLIYVGKNLDSILIPCYQLNLTERSFSERMAQNAILSLHFVVIGSSGLSARHL